MYVPFAPGKLAVPSNALPVNDIANNSPPVSTWSTDIVKSFVGVIPPKNSPVISKVSPT